MNHEKIPTLALIAPPQYIPARRRIQRRKLAGHGRLGRCFDTSARLWLNAQAGYDLEVARREFQRATGQREDTNEFRRFVSHWNRRKFQRDGLRIRSAWNYFFLTLAV